jgi:hypothetical protein
MDEVFGADHIRNEIVWFYENKLATGGNTFDSFHDSLLVYTKGKEWLHKHIMIEVKEVKMQPVTEKQDGKRVWLRDDNGKRKYQESRPERPVGDVWVIPIVNPVASERAGYPTQKPESLLERVIGASSNPSDLILDCFIGSGTTAVVAQKLGCRWIGCDINKGAIQTTSKRLQGIIQDQIAAAKKDGKPPLPLEDGKAEPPAPAQLAFSVWRVNDYDLQIQHNEAVALACEHIGVTRTRADGFFDGTLGKSLVKIIPFNHPLSPLDLEEIKRELDARPDEDRPVTCVCLGQELAAAAWVEEWNRLRRGKDAANKIAVIELRTDPRYGKFFQHAPATAKARITRAKDTIQVVIEDFISPSILERLREQAGVLTPRIDDWRAMVDCVMIDAAYDGQVFKVTLADVPEKKTDFVNGAYELAAPKGKTTVALKIVDMLGEEVLVTAHV